VEPTHQIGSPYAPTATKQKNLDGVFVIQIRHSYFFSDAVIVKAVILLTNNAPPTMLNTVTTPQNEDGSRLKLCDE
jgi:hypothetical protein